VSLLRCDAMFNDALRCFIPCLYLSTTPIPACPPRPITPGTTTVARARGRTSHGLEAIGVLLGLGPPGLGAARTSAPRCSRVLRTNLRARSSFDTSMRGLQQGCICRGLHGPTTLCNKHMKGTLCQSADQSCANSYRHDVSLCAYTSTAH
jgi:hypothetical protein